eukprot:2430221-Prymnesium_polylepis.2
MSAARTAAAAWRATEAIADRSRRLLRPSGCERSRGFALRDTQGRDSPDLRSPRAARLAARGRRRSPRRNRCAPRPCGGVAAACDVLRATTSLQAQRARRLSPPRRWSPPPFSTLRTTSADSTSARGGRRADDAMADKPRHAPL